MLRMRIAAGALALATAGFAWSSAWATSTTVSTTRTTALNMSGSDTLNITSTGVFTLSGTAVTINNASTSALTITNLGTLNSTGNRAIRINDGSGNAATNAHSLTVINGSSTNSTALIQAGDATHTGDDAIQSSNALNGGTIEIDNYGTIYSNGNRAINLTAATGGTVTINNYATGVIKAVGTKDVIRPASGSTIYNYGKIQSTDEATQGNRGDAIDFQSNATDTVYGTVYNYTGGLIEGAKHGITGNIGKSNAYYIENDADAAITGLNGSGINLDIPDDIAAIADDVQKRAAVALLKTATVVNYGTITGEAHDSTGTDTDGDGIDIDSVVDIENYGTVQALGAIGNKDGNPDDPNISDGLAIGGGTVNNYAGGVIYSVGRGIQVDDSEAGAEFAATKIYNEGKIEGGVLAINIVGDLADTLTNKGTIIGNVYMGGGDDTVSLYTGSSLSGTLDGGDGTGDLLKLEFATANATGSLSGVVNFEKLAVDAGIWTLTDDESYSGGTTVADGATLKADAALTSAVTVDAGGTLGGSGTVSSIDAYGTVAPGNSIGTLSTTGNVVFESGSTFAVEVNDTPEADFLSVGGTANLAGGTVDVTALTGAWANYNKVAILTAAGGIVSDFAGVTDDAAFLNSSLEYDGDTAYLVLYRNDVAFTDITETPNQRNVAGAVDAGGSSSGLYAHLIADTDSQARSDLDSLSGETYASNAGTLADQSALIADTLLSRFQATPPAGTGTPLAYGDDTRAGANAAAKAIAEAPVYSAWAKGFGQSLALNSDGNAGSVNGGIGGGLIGMDVTAAGIPRGHRRRLRLGILRRRRARQHFESDHRHPRCLCRQRDRRVPLPRRRELWLEQRQHDAHRHRRLAHRASDRVLRRHRRQRLPRGGAALRPCRSRPRALRRPRLYRSVAGRLHRTERAGHRPVVGRAVLRQPLFDPRPQVGLVGRRRRYGVAQSRDGRLAPCLRRPHAGAHHDLRGDGGELPRCWRAGRGR
jgi:hypothetical protein